METILCYAVIYLVEAFILWQYCNTLFSSIYSTINEVTILFFAYSLLFFVSFHEFFIMNFLFFFVINFVCILFVYRIKWTSALFHSGILTLIMLTCELLVILFFTKLSFHMFLYQENYWNLALLAVFSKLLYFFISYFIAHSLSYVKEKKEKQGLNKFTAYLVVLPFFSLWITFTIFLLCESSTFSQMQNRMIAVSAIFILIMNIFIFWIYNYSQKRNMEFTDMQLQLQKENNTSQYYKMLLQQDENQKILIHDIKKHLQSIAVLNQQNQNTKLTAYLNKITALSSQATLRVCNHELVNVILSNYTNICDEKNINLRCDIRTGTLDNISDNDLTALFCNLLDNAVESAEKVKSSFIELNIFYEKQCSSTIISLINSCRTNPFINNSNRLISSKKDSVYHGYGLKSVKRIVKSYHGEIQLYYDEENNAFHSILQLKKK